MPFITPDRRQAVDDNSSVAEAPGDRCYAYYRPMVSAWKHNPRWTTAHMIFRVMDEAISQMAHMDNRAAYQLAWQVFFQLYVMPYELKKREENGDI